MARRTATSYRAGKAAAGAAPEDQPEAPEAAAPAAQGQGPTFLDALVITTTVLLVGAILMTDHYTGTRFAAGFLF